MKKRVYSLLIADFVPPLTPFLDSTLPYASCVHEHIQPRNPRVYFQSTYFSPVLIDPVDVRLSLHIHPRMTKELAPSR